MLQLAIAAATFLGGAFFGSQVDDKVDNSHPYAAISNGVSGGKMLTYGLMALGALVVYQKFVKKVL